MTLPAKKLKTTNGLQVPSDNDIDEDHRECDKDDQDDEDNDDEDVDDDSDDDEHENSEVEDADELAQTETHTLGTQLHDRRKSAKEFAQWARTAGQHDLTRESLSHIFDRNTEHKSMLNADHNGAVVMNG